MRIGLIAALCVTVAGCAHRPLSGEALDRVTSPAFISRIEEGAGPRSAVFRDDESYRPRLKRLDPKEADRRLAERLRQAMSRFEIAERLRANTTSLLPRERPWTHTVDPAKVAAVLQSFLVEEVPANPPDYQLLRDLGADSVVEFVIEEYGIRSEDGKAGAYLLGYGRMFTLDGRELWRRSFKVDQLLSGAAGMDPFKVAKDRELWRSAMDSMLDGVAVQFAKDLSPADRHPAASAAPAATAPAPSSGTAAPPSGDELLEEGGDNFVPHKETDQAPAPAAPAEGDPL